jgi:hypothetical protein
MTAAIIVLAAILGAVALVCCAFAGRAAEWRD